MYKILIITLCLLLTSCAAQHNNNKLANRLHNENPEKILAILQEEEPATSDHALYYLNVGYLQLITGQFDSAIESLNAAKKEMLALSATSITENVAAGTVNETFRRYSGYPTDKIMVHNMLALSYLFKGDIYGARVEMLQADVSMKKMLDGDELTGQLISAHLLTGIIYELLNERSNAFISYKFSEEILIQRNMTVPTGLKFALTRMSKKMGNDEAYRTYSKRYSDYIAPVSKQKKQLFNLYFDGVVSNKYEQSITVPNLGYDQLIRISMPAYPASYRTMQRDKITDGIHQVRSELIENIEVLVREDLKEEYPSILLLTTTRAIAKYQLVKKANEHDSLLGALANLATMLSEVADVRSWNMLPSTIQFSYLETNEDTLTVSTHKGDSSISLAAGKQYVILTSSLSEKVFHYQH